MKFFLQLSYPFLSTKNFFFQFVPDFGLHLGVDLELAPLKNTCFLKAMALKAVLVFDKICG